MAANEPVALLDLSLKILLVPATKPFLGLRGLDPGSVLRFTNKPKYYWAFRQWLACAGQGLTRSSMGGCWNQV